MSGARPQTSLGSVYAKLLREPSMVEDAGRTLIAELKVLLFDRKDSCWHLGPGGPGREAAPTTEGTGGARARGTKGQCRRVGTGGTRRGVGKCEPHPGTRPVNSRFPELSQ